MSEELTMKYTPEQNDYVQVLRIFFLKQTGIRISLAFLAVAFVIILVTVARQAAQVTVFEIVWLLLPPLFVFYILYFQPRSMAKRAMSTEQLSAETTWKVGEGGVEISTSAPVWVVGEDGEKVQAEPTPALLAWDNLKQLISAKEYFLLVFKTERNFFRFLPRRAFASPDQQQSFLDQVTSHLKR